MTVFADSSALVKLYADEAGHDHVGGLEPLVAAHVARVEVPAALWAKHRSGEITAEDARVLVDDFEADWSGTGEEPPRFAAVILTEEVLEAAARGCARHGLRAYDGVQLACALAARAVEPACEQFAAFDRDLRAAAAAEGFGLVPEDVPASPRI